MKDNVITLPGNARALSAVRGAINERAKNIGASDEQRRHAIGVAFAAMREGRSSALAISLGNSDLRPRQLSVSCMRPFDGDAA